jgi:signal transduction histidine kinase
MGRLRPAWLTGAAAAVAGAVSFLIGDPLPMVVATAICGALIWLSRARPLWTSLGTAAVLGAFAPSGDLSVAPVFAAAQSFAVARWAPRWPAVAGAVALLVVTTAGAGQDYVPFWLTVTAAWLAGRALREHELMAARLEARAAELEAEREEYARLSVRYERARIASELHDIVAHAITVMVVQATAGQAIAATDRAAANESFATIAGAAREAQDDLGRVIALLGDADELSEAPDLVLVEELVERAARTGLAVTLQLEGERQGLSREAVQVTYRVVQESMTNALRYAAGSAMRVVVRGDPDALLVEVCNDSAPTAPALSGHGTGNGLVGLRERISACGGTFDAGPSAGGGWSVRARVPRHAAAQA